MHIGVAILLIALGAVLLKTLSASKPKIKKKKPAAAVTFVRTMRVATGAHAVRILSEGTVRADMEIELLPQVGGKVVYVSPSLVNGGYFKKRDVLLRIDPVDYELALTLARAKVKDSEANLRIAEEESAAAKEEWRFLNLEDQKAEEAPPPLVAKEPQLAAAQAKLDAELAELKKAELALERTVIRAPFNGRVSEESVDVGQYVSKAQPLASLYSTDVAQIVVPLENEGLMWFHVPGLTPGSGPGSDALVHANFAGKKRTWPAVVVRAQGKLDEQTRMVNIVVRVENPFAKKPPLIPGLFVTVEIRGSVIKDSAIIPRAALRQGDMVWVVDKDGRLRFRNVEVARIQNNDVLISSGLKDRELVVVSPLKAVSDGMAVRTVRAGKGAGK